MTPTHRSSQSGTASKKPEEGPTWGIRDLGTNQRDSGTQGTSPRAQKAAGDGTQGAGQSQKRSLKSMDEEE